MQGNRQKSKVVKEAEALEELDTIKQSPRSSSQSSSRFDHLAAFAQVKLDVAPANVLVYIHTLPSVS